MCPEDIEAARAAGCATLACNDNWVYDPDVLYCPDYTWIAHHKGVPTLRNKWAPTDNVKKTYPDWHWIKIWPNANDPGLSWDPWVIAHGSNAGRQMLNIAALAGANPIILTGYDMQPTYGKLRWKGKQPPGVEKGGMDKFERWRQGFATTASELRERGIRVINCSRETALNCFERRDLSATLRELCGAE